MDISLLNYISMAIAYVFGFIVLFIAIVIFFENRNPAHTIAWILVLLLLPVVGFIFYIIFGVDFRQRRLFKKMSEAKGAMEWDALIENQKERVERKLIFNYDKSGDEVYKLMSLLLSNSQTPFTSNNTSRIFSDGDEAFKFKKEAIENAQNHIHLLYFIVKDDKLGNEIKELLIKKAKEGVEVRFIYDGFGGFKLSKKYLNDLKEAGVDVRSFLPIRVPLLNTQSNHRNHRKILIVDGFIGFLGGLNIGDEYINKNPKYPFWRDTHMQIVGEAVYVMQNIFLKDWYFIAGEMPTGKRYFPKIDKVGQELIQIVPSGPDFDWESIQQAYFSIITSAKKKIHITTPYLIPDESILMALKTAALSGIDVKIIVPGIPDKKFVYYATFSYCKELIKAGVKVYKYKKGFIHAKVVTVDETIGSIGTANFDNRSFRYSFEINAFCFDEKVIRNLEDDFSKDLEESEEVLLSDLEQQNIWEKFKESAARLASPLL